MDRIDESICSVETNTLKGTKESLRYLYDIATEVPSKTLKQMLDAQTGLSARYLLQLFLGCAHVSEGNYRAALEVARSAVMQMKEVNTRVLDGVAAGLWTVVRIAATATKENMLQEYLVGLAANKEYQNTESTVVLINSVLMHLTQEEMYDEAYTFLRHTALPENADVGHSAVFYYLGGVVYLMAGEYSTSEEMINLAVVKSTDTEFTKECRKVQILAYLHQGKHPNRRFFDTSSGLEKYQKLLLAIKSCSLEMFYKAVEEGKDAFRRDGMYQVVVRLEAAVQKEHLRRIGVVYTRIALKEVGHMVGVSEESAIFLLQKAINEKAISGCINTETREYVSIEKQEKLREGLEIEGMLSIANTLAMLKKHEPIKRKTLEEMQTEMMHNEYQL